MHKPIHDRKRLRLALQSAGQRLSRGRILLLAGLLLAGLSAGEVRPSVAQEHHQYHNSYQNWSSGVTPYCCNNQDCSDIADSRVRENANGTAIEINGEWCPVYQKHRITKGQSPDWSKYHACIQPDHSNWTLPDGKIGRKAPCERLLCFVTKGGGI